jgi:bacteriorhodopsin
MLNYELYFFLGKYIICLGLIIHLIKTKNTKHLFQAISTSFLVVSGIILINFLLTLNSGHQPEKPFYFMDFTQFMLMVLVLNYFISWRSR